MTLVDDISVQIINQILTVISPADRIRAGYVQLKFQQVLSTYENSCR